MFLGIKGVDINIYFRNYLVRSVRDGDYWRLFFFGVYKVIVSKRGYYLVEKIVRIFKGLVIKENFVLESNG